MRYPSPRVVRGVKNACIVLPLLTFMFGLLFITVKYADQTHSGGRGRSHHERRKHRVISPEEQLEQSGICDNLIEYTQLANGTVVSMKSTNSSVYINDTVRSFCKWYKETSFSYYLPQKVKVARFKHQFLIPGKTICDDLTDIVILVHSLHDYHEKRMAIRSTWGNAVRSGKWVQGMSIIPRISLAFVFGLHSQKKSWDEVIRKESEKYNDIIQGDFYEHYHNMTLKSLLGLKWTYEHCPSAKLLVKSDDDMIINWPYLLEELGKQKLTKAIMGPYNEGSRALRNGKWKISKEEFPFHFYPPYESGSAYIITTDIVKPLFQLSEYVPHIFIDDVYVTGILGRILGVRHIKHPGFAFWTDKRPTVCHLLRNWILTGTKMTPHTNLLDLWGKMQTTNVKTCPETMPE